MPSLSVILRFAIPTAVGALLGALVGVWIGWGIALAVFGAAAGLFCARLMGMRKISAQKGEHPSQQNAPSIATHSPLRESRPESDQTAPPSFFRNIWLFLTFRAEIGRLTFCFWVLIIAWVSMGIEVTPYGFVFKVYLPNALFVPRLLTRAFMIRYGEIADGNFLFWIVTAAYWWLLLCAFNARARALRIGVSVLPSLIVVALVFKPLIWAVFTIILCWPTPKELRPSPTPTEDLESEKHPQVKNGESSPPPPSPSP